MGNRLEVSRGAGARQVQGTAACLLTIPLDTNKGSAHVLLCLCFWAACCLLDTAFNTRVRKRHSLYPHKLRIYNQSSVQPVVVGMFSLLKYFKGKCSEFTLKKWIWKENILNSLNTFCKGHKAVKWWGSRWAGATVTAVAPAISFPELPEDQLFYYFRPKVCTVVLTQTEGDWESWSGWFISWHCWPLSFACRCDCYRQPYLQPIN